MTMTTLNFLQSLFTQGTSLPEPVALLFVGTLMISLGNLQRRVSLAKVSKETGKI
jgi:hypothetical protein